MSKVSLIRCESYDQSKVFEAVKKSIDLLGGIGEFVKPGMKVLLKPNLLSPRPPEDAVDTHPEIVRAVVKLVKGAGGIPIIGDSPGGFGKNVEEVYVASGMRKVADEEGVELVKFTSSKFVGGIPISRYVFDVGCFISLPKLKTHCVTVLTAAIKNTFGTIPGLYKAGCHSRAPKEGEFAALIARVHSASRPHLNILDGILAMEGDGPSGGKPRMMNLVAASRDAVALDSCAAHIMGLKPLDILVTKEAHALGLGEADLTKIEIAGDAIDSFKLKDFVLPQTLPLHLVPTGIAHGIASLIRFKPYIDMDICAHCNLCKLSCPTSAITIEPDNCEIDYSKCIVCMCCHEVCPYKAIRIKRNILTKLVWG